jgi:uncharacterized protein
MKLSTIIFIGPAGAGKTTAIQSISDIQPMKTAVSNSTTDTEKQPKATALDYGLINLKDGGQIHLYGASGDEQYKLMSGVVAGNEGVGIVLLLDNTGAYPFKDMLFFLESFKVFVTPSNIAIGITKMDINEKPTIADYYVQMQVSGLKPPIFAVNATARKDVSLLVQALLYSLDPVQAA